MKAVIILVVCVALAANAQPRSRRSLLGHGHTYGYSLPYSGHGYVVAGASNAMQNGAHYLGQAMQNGAKMLGAFDAHTVETTSASIAAIVARAAASVDQIISDATNNIVQKLEAVLNQAYLGLGNTANTLNSNMVASRDSAIQEAENLAAFIDQVGDQLVKYATDIIRQGATAASQEAVNGVTNANNIISNAVSNVVLAAQQAANAIANDYNVGETQTVNDFNQGSLNVQTDIFNGYAKAGSTLRAGQIASEVTKANAKSALVANGINTANAVHAANYGYGLHHGLHH